MEIEKRAKGNGVAKNDKKYSTLLNNSSNDFFLRFRV
jgi:D-serine dehydratase